MTRRSDQLNRIEAALGRIEAAIEGHAVILRETGALTQAKLGTLESEVSDLAGAVRDVLAARALRDTAPQAIPGAGNPQPPADPAAPAADDGTAGEAVTVVRRAPRNPRTKGQPKA